MGTIEDRRRLADRRFHDIPVTYDRRVLADRRVHNIFSEWIPFEAVAAYPEIRDAFTGKKAKTRKNETNKKAK